MMRHLTTVIVCALFFVALSPAQCGEQIAASAQSSENWESRISELERELQELRDKYADQISQLERKIASLTAMRESAEADALKRAAEQEASEEAEAPEETVFESGALGLQALNPEISVTGDMVSSVGKAEGSDTRSDFDFRGLGLHFESYLDPYSRFKAAVPVGTGGSELGEAYLTRYDVGGNLNVTLGKFHQQFGVVNRWHRHGLDQVDFPLPVKNIFGGPLNQTGVSFDWMLPGSHNTTQELTFQLTDGTNDRLFSGNSRNFPCALLHYKNFRDLSKDKYLEFGLTGLAGRNNEWSIQSPSGVTTSQRNLWTLALGANVTLLCEPTEAMRYRGWVWRTEAYYLMKDILAPDGSGKDTIGTWGAYTYFQKKLSRTLDAGVRFDYYRPDVKDYAATPELSLSPLAVTKSGAYQWQLAPYVTWHQSPWVRWRAEFDHLDGKGLGSNEDRLFLQCIFAAGPHKHERY